MFHSINPFTEEKFNETSPLSDQELETKLYLATRAFTAWNQFHLDKKIVFVQHLKTLLDEKKAGVGFSYYAGNG